MVQFVSRCSQQYSSLAALKERRTPTKGIVLLGEQSGVEIALPIFDFQLACFEAQNLHTN